MVTLFLTLAIFAFAMLIMAVGVIMRRPCLRGSCGGPDVLGPDGESLTCATCPITVRRAMEGVAGVHDVTIDYEAKTATAHFDPARTTMRDIATASTEAGYPAQTQFSGTDL